MGIRFLAGLFAACLLVGCMVPMRVPSKTRTPGGELKQKVDLSFIATGVTTREEVSQKLGWVDTGVSDKYFFFGRWADSSWGVAWAAGGYGAGAAGWNRKWTFHNLLLDYDEKGVVQRVSSFPDKEILQVLGERVREPGEPSADQSAEVSVEYVRGPRKFPGAVVLAGPALSFVADRQTKPKERYDFTTSAANLSHLSLSGMVKEHPEKLTLVIHFREKTPVGRKFLVCVDMRGALALARYVASQGKKNGRQEPAF
jgi:hypothetical protein